MANNRKPKNWDEEDEACFKEAVDYIDEMTYMMNKDLSLSERLINKLDGFIPRLTSVGKLRKKVGSFISKFFKDE